MRLLSLIFLLLITGCANMEFYVFGIDLKELDRIENRDYGGMILGAGASLATHILGHHLAAHAFDVDIRQDSLSERIDYSGNPSDSDVRWMARGGFVLQLTVNTILAEAMPDSYFTRGFTMLTSGELLTYGLRHRRDGDFNLLDDSGGEGDLEYFLYGLWGVYNFCRINLKERYEDPER